MGIPISRGLFVWTLLSFTNQVVTEGVFELELLSFKNDFGYNAEGNCCEGVLHSGYCTSNCRTFFRICLKHYQSRISPDPPCTFGSVTSPFLGENSFTIADNLNSFSNPVKLPFEFSWPGTFSLIIEVFHDTTMTGPEKDSPREMISQLMTQRSAEVSERWTNDTFHDTYTALQYRYRVVCAESYYGPKCEVTCTPRNDQFGHYTCGEQGEKICNDGWHGAYCTEAICLPGCDGENGFCEQPNECKCKLGWQGMYCNTCIPYPGCDHGTCQRPWECTCEENWGGLFCNQNLIICTTLAPCKNGATCYNTGQGGYTCSCVPGYNGTNCETKINSCEYEPCLHGGTCQDDGASYVCRCPEGYKGRHCESSAMSCAENPCEHGGTCVSTYDGASYVCTCSQGYTGENCEVEVNECESNPCVNGNCVDELHGYRCVCQAGYKGPTCADEVYECSHSPCLHGGTCIDKVNDFMCQCVAGWSGPLCQENVNDCLLLPCANGGICHDLVNDFLCDCAPGFGGKDCRINIDDCAVRPCYNGGTCIDGLNEYTCECDSGYHGKHCELIMGQTAPVKTMDKTDTLSTKAHNVNTLPPSTTIVSTTAHVTDHVTDHVTQRQQKVIVKDESVVSMQVTLIVCLGIGLPCLVIIAVLVFLLLRRRRNARANARTHDAHTDNARNLEIASNMNNKSHSSKLQSESVHSALQTLKLTNEDSLQTLKLTNEDSPPSRTLKNINRNNLNTDSNRSKNYNKKDLNTKMRRNKDNLDTRQSASNPLDCKQLPQVPSAHSSEPSYSGGGGGGGGGRVLHHPVVKSYNRDLGTSSSIYCLDNQPAHLTYTEASHLPYTERAHPYTEQAQVYSERAHAYIEHEHTPYTEAVLATEV